MHYFTQMDKELTQMDDRETEKRILRTFGAYSVFWLVIHIIHHIMQATKKKRYDVPQTDVVWMRMESV